MDLYDSEDFTRRRRYGKRPGANDKTFGITQPAFRWRGGATSRPQRLTPMPKSRWIWRCEHDIPSKTGAGQRVMEEVIEQLQRHHWVRHDIYSVHLAMQEGLANAIIHGNQFDTAKHVHVACRMSPNLLQIKITDEGNGFDPTKVPDPTDASRLECPDGRGIMLMHSFMSRVEYNDVGNSIVLEKERAKPDD